MRDDTPGEGGAPKETGADKVVAEPIPIKAPARPEKIPAYQLVLDRILCHKATPPSSIADTATLFWTSVVAGADGKPSQLSGAVHHDFSTHSEWRNNPQLPIRWPHYQDEHNPYPISPLDATLCSFTNYFYPGGAPSDYLVWFGIKLVKGKNATVSKFTQALTAAFGGIVQQTPKLAQGLTSAIGYAQVALKAIDTLYDPNDVLLSAIGSWTQGFFNDILATADWRFQNTPNNEEILCLTAAKQLCFYQGRGTSTSQSALPFDVTNLDPFHPPTLSVADCNSSYEVWLRIEETFTTAADAAKLVHDSDTVPQVNIYDSGSGRSMC